MVLPLKTLLSGAGEMNQQLGPLAALPEDPGSVPCAHIATPVPGAVNTLTHTCKHKFLKMNIKFKYIPLPPSLCGNLKFGSEIVVLLTLISKYFNYNWIESMLFSQRSGTS